MWRLLLAILLFPNVDAAHLLAPVQTGDFLEDPEWVHGKLREGVDDLVKAVNSKRENAIKGMLYEDVLFFIKTTGFEIYSEVKTPKDVTLMLISLVGIKGSIHAAWFKASDTQISSRGVSTNTLVHLMLESGRPLWMHVVMTRNRMEEDMVSDQYRFFFSKIRMEDIMERAKWYSINDKGKEVEHEGTTLLIPNCSLRHNVDQKFATNGSLEVATELLRLFQQVVDSTYKRWNLDDYSIEISAQLKIGMNRTLLTIWERVEDKDLEKDNPWRFAKLEILKKDAPQMKSGLHEEDVD